jgi:hypothetical protein
MNILAKSISFKTNTGDLVDSFDGNKNAGKKSCPSVGYL